MFKKSKPILAFTFLLGAFSTAQAYTECTGKVTRVWTGNGGGLWVIMDTGLVWNTTQANPDMKNILASAMTAMVSDRSVTIRFSADGIACAGTRSDVEGMWLNSQ